MMASSTTMPMASDMPSSVKKLIVNPSIRMMMNVPSAEVGIESSTLKVEVHEPRNAQQTRPVTTTESSTVSSVSRIASEVKRVPSKLTSMCRSGSVTASSLSTCSTNARTAVPTFTSFSPCCFWMPTPSVIFPSLRARLRVSARPSSIVATSRK